MQYTKRTFAILFFLISTFNTRALASEPALPGGHYIFLGDSLGSAEPKLLFIDAEGKAWWKSKPVLESKPSSEARVSQPGSTPVFQAPPLLNSDSLLWQPSSSPASTPSSSGTGEPSSKQLETQYPTVKWEPRPVSRFPGGVATLLTTHSRNELRLKLTLLKVEPSRRWVNILDKDGLRIGQNILFEQFAQVPGTWLFESFARAYMTEEDYRKAADYSVE